MDEEGTKIDKRELKRFIKKQMQPEKLSDEALERICDGLAEELEAFVEEAETYSSTLCGTDYSWEF